MEKNVMLLADNPWFDGEGQAILKKIIADMKIFCKRIVMRTRDPSK